MNPTIALFVIAAPPTPEMTFPVAEDKSTLKGPQILGARRAKNSTLRAGLLVFYGYAISGTVSLVE